MKQNVTNETKKDVGLPRFLKQIDMFGEPFPAFNL